MTIKEKRKINDKIKELNNFTDQIEKKFGKVPFTTEVYDNVKDGIYSFSTAAECYSYWEALTVLCELYALQNMSK